MRNGQRVGPKTGSHSSLTCLGGVEEDRNKNKKKKEPHKRNKKEKEKPAYSLFRFLPFTVIAGIFVMYGRGFCTSKELYCFSNK